MGEEVQEMLKMIFGYRYVGLRKLHRQNCIGVCITHMFKKDAQKLKKYNYDIEKIQGSTYSSIIIAIKKNTFIL